MQAATSLVLPVLAKKMRPALSAGCFPPGTRAKNALLASDQFHKLIGRLFFWRPRVHPSKIFCSERNSGRLRPPGPIYNPQIMYYHRCIAEPGSFDALYCPAPPTAGSIGYSSRTGTAVGQQKRSKAVERVTKITQLHKNDMVRWCEQLIVGRRYYDPHMPEKTQRRFGGTPNLRSALAAQGVVANHSANPSNELC